MSSVSRPGISMKEMFNMKTLPKICLFTGLLQVLIFHETAANGREQDSTYRWISAGFSALAYKGDLGGSYSKWTGAINGSLQFNTHKKWSGSLNLLAGTVSGQDLDPRFNVDPAGGRIPNSYFRSTVAALYYQLLWNVYLGRQFRIFLGQGAGFFRYAPHNEEGVSLAAQTNTRASNETYGTITILAPSSLGAAWRFKNDFGLSYRLSLLNTGTDYLDNIAQFGSEPGTDNILAHQFALLIPLQR